MKSLLHQVLEPWRKRDRIFQVNIVKEFLQEVILHYLSRKGYGRYLTFEGGTCLRFVYGLRRFSEDLDFSMREETDIEGLISGIKKELELQGYEVEVKKGGKGNVKRYFYKFPGLLHYCNIPSQKEEKVSVLLEIDTNPPWGGRIEETLLNRNFLFTVIHYDLPALMAKKIHAILFRGFEKGRDYYDLLWLLTKDITPDIDLLNNACKQTSPDFSLITPKNWKRLLADHLEKKDMRKIKMDVLPFLEIPEDTDLLEKEIFMKLLREI